MRAMSSSVQPDDIEPWEQQPAESAKAYAAFSVYRDMEPSERSQRKVGRHLGKSGALLSDWSVRHQWVMRVKAWDRHREQLARAEVLKRHRTALSSAVRVLSQPINVLVTAMQSEPLLAAHLADELIAEVTSGRRHGLAAYDRLMRLIATTSGSMAQLLSAERLSYGMSSSNVAIGESEHDFAVDADNEQPDSGKAAIIREALLRLNGLTSESSGPGAHSDQR